MTRITFIFLLIVFISCEKNNLSKEFNCRNNTEYSDLKQYRDVLKKFKIDLPTDWKTNLYYDDFSSEIFSADTTKSLTNSFIVEISWRQGELVLDDNFSKSLSDSLQLKENLKTVKSGSIEFKENPGYWNLSKGRQSGYTYNFLQLYVKTELDEYVMLTTKIYGDQYIDNRLCESITLLDEIVFLK